MSSVERKAPKRKRQYVATESRNRDDIAEDDWFSPTQASLGLNAHNNQRPKARTSATLERITSPRRDMEIERSKDNEPGYDSVQYDWEYRRIRKKIVQVDSIGAGSDQEQGAGLVIWDEDENAGFDTELIMRAEEENNHSGDTQDFEGSAPQQSQISRPVNAEDSSNDKALETDEDRASDAGPAEKVKDHMLLLEEAREARLRALGPEEPSEKGGDVWGGSDEEPPDAVRELMARTATHLQSANNPAQLIARILTNHGGDDRFAFLRGRWRRAWATARAKARASTCIEPEQNDGQTKSQEKDGLVGLNAYSDSDDDEAVEETHNLALGQQTTARIQDAATIERRRQKAREWAAKRKAQQEGKE